MVETYKSPGVFVEEISAHPPSVSQVETAIPAFIGYTAKAERNSESCFKKAISVDALADFESIFGGAAETTYDTYLDSEDRIKAVIPTQPYLLHESLRLFFENGGGKCYIIAVGAFKPSGSDACVDYDEIISGLAVLEKHDEPTIIVCPDATLLASDRLYDYQKQALAQCAKLGDRVALCDTYPSDETKKNAKFADRVQQFRDKIGVSNLKYGAAYAPYVRSNPPKKVRFQNLNLRRGDVPPGGVNTPVSLEALTPDPGIRQLILDLQCANEAVDHITAIESTSAPGILTDPNADLASEFKSLLDTFQNAPTTSTRSTALKRVFDFALDYFEAVWKIRKDLPKETDTTPGPASSTRREAFTLRSEIGGLAETSGLRDAFETLGRHGIQYDKLMQGDGDSPFAHALGILGITVAEYNNLPGTTIAALYDGKPESKKNDEAGKAIRAFYPVLTKFHRALLSAASTLEATLDNSLAAAMRSYKQMKAQSSAAISEIPPSGPIAGVYARVDAQRGVWKAPANVSLNSVSGPVFAISSEQQEGLNVDAVAGKSINAIRAFTGKGTLVWGARTLAGNDNEWRYVNVRRFVNMVEESCKKATEPFVFEPNDANTWIRVQGMLENFLTLQWRAGALHGAKPEHAFYVAVGLDKTMTAIDIQEGRMIVEIGLAVVRPAEFVILRFSHKRAEA